MRTSVFLSVAAAALSLSGCAATMANAVGGQSNASPQSVSLEDLLGGSSSLKGSELEKAIAEADKHPLGSDKNPVRVSMPEGQRAYLQSLRCADGKAPQFFRVGNFGIGAFGNIVDGYDVTCPGSTPAKSMIVMDMYHNGRSESRAVAGFTKS